MDDDLARRSATATASKSSAKFTFPTRSGCCIPRSPTTAGFKVNSGEYKVMGLAPYGEPRYVDVIKEKLVDIKDDGSFRLDLDYFDYCTGLTMTNARFDALFGGPPRRPEAPLTQREMDLAASVQAVTEEVVLKLAHAIARETGERNLCLAGGVALNCVANGKLQRQGWFDELWLQPAAGDAGGAIGAALVAAHLYKREPRVSSVGADGMRGSYLGPAYAQDDIERRLEAVGAVFESVGDDGAHRARRPRRSPTARRWAGIRGGWSSGRARWGAGRSSATRAPRRCRSS